MSAIASLFIILVLVSVLILIESPIVVGRQTEIVRIRNRQN
jgi:hypothetical protein